MKAIPGNAGNAYTIIGKLTRRYSWPLVISLLAVTALLFLAGLVAVFLGIPNIKKDLFDIAQFIGCIVLLGSIQAFWKDIRRKYALISLQHTSNHVVVCGLGDKGLRFVTLQRKKGLTVAAIESRKDHPDISGCLERGVVVINGDATDRSVLAMANTAHASFLFAVTGDDNVNIEIALSGHELVTALHKTGENVFLRCYTHVAVEGVRGIFSHHDLFEKTHDGFDASMFSICDTASRHVLEKFAPDIWGRKQGVVGDTLRLLVIGFSQMGEAIVKQAARVGHYLEWTGLEITIVDSGMKQKEARFMAIYGDAASPPSFVVPDVSLRFVDQAPDAIASISSLAGESNGLPSVICVALENDSLAVSLSHRLRNSLGTEVIPVVLCLNTPLAKLMEESTFKFTASRNIHAFNIYDYACAFPVLMGEITDELAKLIHSAYINSLIMFTSTDFHNGNADLLLVRIVTDMPALASCADRNESLGFLNHILQDPKLYESLASKLPAESPAHVTRMLRDLGKLRGLMAEGLSIPQRELVMRLNAALLALAYPDVCPDKAFDNPSLVGWRESTEDIKDFNRWQADHLSVKLRAFGYDKDGPASLDKVTKDADLLGKLSEMEHRRWMAALLMDGWRYAPGKKDQFRKTHPCLVPYDDLPIEEKSKDDSMIHNIRKLVSSPGWERYVAYIQGKGDE